MANFVLLRVASVWFPDSDLLWAETCSSILCVIIEISKEQYCAIFVWLNSSNWLATMRGIVNIGLKYNRNYTDQRLCIRMSLNHHFINTKGNTTMCSVYCIKFLKLNAVHATQ